MDKQTIDDLYRYNRWASTLLLESASTLTREQFVDIVPSSFPSVRDTLVHILWAEWVWLQRWNGTSPRTAFEPKDFPAAEAVASRWAKVHAGQADFLRSLAERDLARIVRYVNLRGETWEYALWKQLLHVVNHSSYHRGQLVTMLRQLGAAPPSTDLLVFYDEAAD
jgi:uncharacterized damage-inducible protein DinB